MQNLIFIFLLAIFTIGYLAIISEHYLKINKTATALFIAVSCWAVYFVFSSELLQINLQYLGKHVADVSQIIFFLMGAMAVVELIDSHGGFKIVTDIIHTFSKRKMLWIISIISFFLSSVLDNLTTTILMVSLLRKIIPNKSDRFLLNVMIIVAANAGGAWTPIGDITTTMLWINGNLTSLGVIKALFLPSFISLLVPLVYYTFKVRGNYPKQSKSALAVRVEPGAHLVFFIGVSSLIAVPIFKGLTGLPPFMGVLIGLSILWLLTDILHYKPGREHLRVPHILTKVDTPSILFFLGILLCINALETAGLLHKLAAWLDVQIKSQALLATFIGLFSAIIDNVPLVAATMGMYPGSAFPTDAPLWHMIAYAAGTGGSILIIGSAAGVALMGMEKIDFFSYMKKSSLIILLGFLAGMGVYLLIRPLA